MKTTFSLDIKYSQRPVIVPEKGCPWADRMVLNPAIIKDPDSGRIHMLFRATGPGQKSSAPGVHDPYPIFLGYACSDDGGLSWTPDFSRPALAPALKDNIEDMFIYNVYGDRVINYSNGCIEDPRLFFLDDRLYLTTASRLFPPGPYWEGDFRQAFLPEWVNTARDTLGRASSENLTVSVLYEVSLSALKEHDYDGAFKLVTHLTDPERGGNRDVYLFPEKIKINGKMQYVCVHRPTTPAAYPGIDEDLLPSILISASENFTGFPTSKSLHKLLVKPEFEWEVERIGGSWPPVKISDSEWLFSYHGKMNNSVGYTQSFMILKNMDNSFPEVAHRCSERLMYAKMEWELEGDLKIPCLFSTGGIIIDGSLVISYGAADEKVGIARINLNDLLSYVRQFDKNGRK